MKDAGSALMGIGRATGDDRAQEAARAAINSPLLEVSINGAKGVLFNVSGGSDLSMSEVNEAAQIITESIDRDAKVIFGSVIDDKLKKGEIKITVVATGFSAEALAGGKSFMQDAGEFMKSKESAFKRENVAESVAVKTVKPGSRPFESQVHSLNDEEGDDEFEVPAFIRRKMK